MFPADDIAVLTLPAKSGRLRQCLFHNRRGIDEDFNTSVRFMRQPSREPLQRAFDDIMIITPLRINRNPRAIPLVRKYHRVLRRRVTHAQHDDRFHDGP